MCTADGRRAQAARGKRGKRQQRAPVETGNEASLLADEPTASPTRRSATKIDALQSQVNARMGLSDDDMRALEARYLGEIPAPHVQPTPVASGLWRAGFTTFRSALSTAAKRHGDNNADWAYSVFEEAKSEIARPDPALRRWIVVGVPPGSGERAYGEIVARRVPDGLRIEVGRHDPCPAEMETHLVRLVEVLRVDGLALANRAAPLPMPVQREVAKRRAGEARWGKEREDRAKTIAAAKVVLEQSPEIALSALVQHQLVRPNWRASVEPKTARHWIKKALPDHKWRPGRPRKSAVSS